ASSLVSACRLAYVLAQARLDRLAVQHGQERQRGVDIAVDHSAVAVRSQCHSRRTHASAEPTPCESGANARGGALGGSAAAARRGALSCSAVAVRSGALSGSAATVRSGALSG